MNQEKTQTDQSGLDGRLLKASMLARPLTPLTKCKTLEESNQEGFKVISKFWALKILSWVWCWLVVSTFIVGVSCINVLYRIQVKGDMLTMGPPYQWTHADNEVDSYPQPPKKR